jgi:hypothetical protein
VQKLNLTEGTQFRKAGPVLAFSAAELHWNKFISTALYCTNTFSAVGLTDTYIPTS